MGPLRTALRILGSVFALVAFASTASAQITVGSGLRIDQPARSIKDLRDQNVVKQRFDFSCGAAALATLLRYGFGNSVTEAQVMVRLFDLPTEAEKADRRRTGFSLLDLQRVAQTQGYDAQGFRLEPGQLPMLGGPVIVFIEPRGYKHFAVLRGIRGDRVYLADPSRGNIRMPMYTFLETLAAGRRQGHHLRRRAEVGSPRRHDAAVVGRNGCPTRPSVPGNHGRPRTVDSRQRARATPSWTLNPMPRSTPRSRAWLCVPAVAWVLMCLPAPALGQEKPPDKPIGEAPEERNAEDVFLRGQKVLLGRGDVVVDVGQFFSRSDDQQLAIVNSALALATREQSILTTILFGRVGVLNETEVFAGTTFNHLTNQIFFGNTDLARTSGVK
jgi:predicted double-glycine peptidase